MLPLLPPATQKVPLAHETAKRPEASGSLGHGPAAGVTELKTLLPATVTHSVVVGHEMFETDPTVMCGALHALLPPRGFVDGRTLPLSSEPTQNDVVAHDIPWTTEPLLVGSVSKLSVGAQSAGAAVFGSLLTMYRPGP